MTLRRRDFVRGAAAAGALGALGCKLLPRNASAQSASRDLMRSSVVVPKDFVGMHFHRWPQGSPLSPAPTYAYGTVRSHDYGIGWNAIHLAPGRFHWDRMDAWVQRHASDGKTLIYTVYGTPAWASSQPGVKDAYGAMGAGAPPKDQAPLADFITALVTRYNGAGKRQVQFVEIWNEPHFNGKGFWWGTAHDLAQLGQTIYTTAKASDSGIKVISPAFDGLPPGHLSFQSTGISAGLRQFFQENAAEPPQRFFDAFAVHTYNADLVDATHGVEGTLLQLKETLQRFHADVPVYVTETGFTPDSNFARSSHEQQGSTLRRQAAVQAALGVKALCFYSHDDDYCGNPSIHSPVAAAINDIGTHLAGQTLRQVSVLGTGEVRVQTRGRTFTW